MIVSARLGANLIFKCKLGNPRDCFAHFDHLPGSGGTMLRGTRRLVNVKAALVLATGVALICPTPAWPQANSATLYGSVTDPAGAVVPAAVVSLVAQDTGISLKKTTEDSG